MRTLYLLRHAEAVNGAAGFPDVARTLSDRGRRSAQFLGIHLRSSPVEIDLVLCSTAVRARQTAEEMIDGIGSHLPILFDHRIYESTVETLHAIVAETNKDVSRLLLVGHNPAIEDFQWFLSGRAIPYGPATLSCIRLGSLEWAAFEGGVGTLEWAVRPGKDGNVHPIV